MRGLGYDGISCCGNYSSGLRSLAHQAGSAFSRASLLPSACMRPHTALIMAPDPDDPSDPFAQLVWTGMAEATLFKPLSYCV